MLNKLPKELLIKIIVERENVDHINNYDDVCDEISKIYTIQEKLVEKRKKIWKQNHEEVMKMFDSSILKHIRNWRYFKNIWSSDHQIEFNCIYDKIEFKFYMKFFPLNDKINDKINNHYNYVVFRNKKVEYIIYQYEYSDYGCIKRTNNYTLEQFIEEYPNYEKFLEICSNKDLSKYIFKESWDH